MLVGYGFSHSRELTWRHLEVSVTRMDRLMTWLTAGAVLLIGYVFYEIGFVQMLLTGTFDRYFGEAQAGPAFMLYQSLIRRGVAVLGITIPILLLRWQECKSRLLLVLASVGLLSMVATAHRGYVAVTVMSFAVTNAVYGRNRKAIVVIVLALVIAFFSAQALFVNIDSSSDGVLNGAMFVLRSGSTEVNDLAWVLSEWNHHWYMGATWAAAVLPIPATISSFKDTYVLSSVTKDIAGIPRESGGGGLRISMFGEAYLNFGFGGVIVLGFLFGVLVRKTNSLIAWAKTQGPLILLPFIFFYFVFLLQSYLSGTGTISDAILSCLTLLVVYSYASRKVGAGSWEQQS